MLSEDWPDSYDIRVDSGPYYGRGDGMFHPSTHPLMPARQLYYHFHPDTRDKMVPRRRTLQSLMTLTVGTAMHSIVQTQMKMVGLIKSDDDIEVDFSIPEHRVRGRIDMIVHHPNGNEYIVEIKSMDPRLYQKLEKIKLEWDAQLSLQEYSQGKSQGILLVAERGGSLRMREFFHHRNDVLLDEIFEKFAFVRACIEKNEPPRHCCILDSTEMKNCPARYECWLREDSQV